MHSATIPPPSATTDECSVFVGSFTPDRSMAPLCPERPYALATAPRGATASLRRGYLRTFNMMYIDGPLLSCVVVVRIVAVDVAGVGVPAGVILIGSRSVSPGRM